MSIACHNKACHFKLNATFFFMAVFVSSDVSTLDRLPSPKKLCRYAAFSQLAGLIFRHTGMFQEAQTDMIGGQTAPFSK